MSNKNNFVPIEEAAALLDVSVEFLKKCIIASIVESEIKNDGILIDMTSVDNFIGIKETAAILSISTRTVRRYSKREKGKRLESYRFSTNLYYQLSDIEKFIGESANIKEERSC